MNLYFNLNYDTIFGEELVLNVVENSGDEGKAVTTSYRMSTIDGRHWWYNMVLNTPSKKSTIRYYYSVEAQGKCQKTEWRTVTHSLSLTAEHGTIYTVYNHWNAFPEDSYRYSSAFTDCISHCHIAQLPASRFNKTVRLIVRAPQLRSGQHLSVIGAEHVLGEWNPIQSVAMTQQNYNEWALDLDADDFEENEIEFKFALVDESNPNEPLWEEGLNRTVELTDMVDGEVAVYELDQSFYAIPNDRFGGTLVPVFSLRSEGGFGVGDFGDLKMMIDFVAATKQRVLQILPINDTTINHTWTDSYPYSCISIFALHPQYADLRQLPEIKDEEKRAALEKKRQELNALPQIDYEAVNNTKTCYLKEIFTQEGAAIMKTTGFKEFFKENSSWLVPYGQYCHLRDTYGTAEFSTWPDHNTWNEADRKALSSTTTKMYKEVAFYYYVQYVLSVQMQQAHDHARKMGVVLKGDIPIGVNRNGCDVWMEPKYFNLNAQAGAPPDDFSVNGQNWGFPTYNWDAMIEDGCSWWVRRFQNMSKYFDAYRIDHVLGFFRIWEIPIDSVHGLLGQFSPSLGMTRGEIETYGLQFQEEQFTRPFIADWTLDRIFHERAGEVKEKYLVNLHDDIYALRPEYDTQRKIEKAFEGADQEGQNLRDGLYALVSDVLFIRDRKDPNKFHPRITAQLDFAYEALYDCDKAAFNRLYNDYFYRRNNQFWYGEAMKKMPKLVEATRMLVCAEDLGMVPDCVAWVMGQLRILSLEIQSMPKDPTVRFGHLSRNPYRSVCCLDSHDMPTLRQWWDEDYERAQNYFNTMLYHGGPAPHPLPGWLARDIIVHQLESPSMLCILSIQDYFAIDEKIRLADKDAERINIPANPKHYWRYRIHKSLEQMMENESFKQNISDLMSQTGRG